jgi:hypothetical protein
VNLDFGRGWFHYSKSSWKFSQDLSTRKETFDKLPMLNTIKTPVNRVFATKISVLDVTWRKLVSAQVHLCRNEFSSKMKGTLMLVAKLSDRTCCYLTIRKRYVNAFLKSPAKSLVNVPRMICSGQNHNDLVFVQRRIQSIHLDQQFGFESSWGLVFWVRTSHGTEGIYLVDENGGWCVASGLKQGILECWGIYLLVLY